MLKSVAALLPEALVLAQEELVQTGKVLLRNAPIKEAADVARVSATVWGGKPDQFMERYALGVTTRNKASRGVFEVNLEPPDLPVTQHTEMSYLDDFPGFIAFFAKQAAREGGKTVVSDNVAISNALPPAFKERLRREGVQYHRRLACAEATTARPCLPCYKTWQSAFGTSSRAAAQAAVDSATDSLEWRDTDGSLSWKSHRPAFHLLGGPPREGSEEVMMNQLYTLHASLIDHSTEIYGKYAGLPPDEQPYTSRWGSGEEFCDDDIVAIGELIEAHSQVVDLRSGDLVILDNRRWGHGREPYDGGPREILVAMSTAVQRRTVHVPGELDAARYIHKSLQ
jgi:hypothetical protein